MPRNDVEFEKWAARVRTTSGVKEVETGAAIEFEICAGRARETGSLGGRETGSVRVREKGAVGTRERAVVRGRATGGVRAHETEAGRAYETTGLDASVPVNSGKHGSVQEHATVSVGAPGMVSMRARAISGSREVTAGTVTRVLYVWV